MERIQDEMTALASQGLSIELIKQGECLEFDAETKINKKNKYTLLEPVAKVIEMYTKDLQAAYVTIEQLETELAESQTALDNVTQAANKSAQQVKQILAGEKKFGDAEKKLAELMANVEQLRQSHAEDGALIAQLQQKIQDAQANEDSINELTKDVQFVLNALETSMKNAGINLDDILNSIESVIN